MTNDFSKINVTILYGQNNLLRFKKKRFYLQNDKLIDFKNLNLM